MSGIHVFTIAAANYFPKVRVLFQSLRRWRPEWKLHLAIADAPPVTSALASVGADEVHLLSELGIPNLQRWKFCHSCIELATAIKPFTLRRLLARPDCRAAIFFDPDIAVFSPLDEIAESFAESDILLTPHLTVPASTMEGVIANEICTVQHGIYNLGFIGVAGRQQGRAFADWWADRAYRFCREDRQNGIYTDQRWIDLVPGFFDRVRILRSPSLNVAPWNLSGRRLAGGLNQGITVNGVALGFYHFSQVDSDANDRSTATQAIASELVNWYRGETRPLANEPTSSTAWGFGAFDDGTPILNVQRAVYRLRNDLQHAYPHPFKSGAHSYASWWRAHARREFPALFDPARREGEIMRLFSALIYGRTVNDILTEFEEDSPKARMPWLDERASVVSASRSHNPQVLMSGMSAKLRKMLSANR